MRYFPRHLEAEAPESGSAESVSWEEIRCNLCGSSRSRPLIEAPDWSSSSGLVFGVVQCNDCGLAYTNPRPAGESLGQFYDDDYGPHQLLHMKQSSWYRRIIPGTGGWRPPFAWHGDGRLLDFGCGAGKFLLRMRSWHWKVTGIDFAEAAVKRARQATGLPILAGTLPHPELAPNSFDVITMWQALEHVPDPMQTIQEARKLLTWNGKLVIGVPNLESLGFRVFGIHWHGLELPRHLTHFTPWTLRLMLERAGFRVESIRMDPRSGWLRHSAKRACRVQQPRSAQRWLRNKLTSRLAATYSHLTGRADAMIATATPVDRL